MMSAVKPSAVTAVTVRHTPETEIESPRRVFATVVEPCTVIRAASVLRWISVMVPRSSMIPVNMSAPLSGGAGGWVGEGGVGCWVGRGGGGRCVGGRARGGGRDIG